MFESLLSSADRYCHQPPMPLWNIVRALSRNVVLLYTEYRGIIFYITLQLIPKWCLSFEFCIKRYRGIMVWV
mgnify:CR=1 FL=1